jgi:WD40 repeat protein
LRISQRPVERFVNAKGLVPDGPIVSAVAVSPDGRWIAAGSRLKGGGIRVWPIPQAAHSTSQPPSPRFELQEHVAADLAFSGDGETLLIVTDDGVEIWDVASGSRRLSFAGSAAQFSPDSRRLALRRPAELLVLDTSTGMTVFEKRTLRYDVVAFSFTKTGDLLVADNRGRLHAWSGTTGDEISLADALRQ